MDLRTLFYQTFMSSVLVFFLVIVLFLFLVEYMIRSKEGFDTHERSIDHLSSVIKSIRSAQKDSRMSETQKQALENALYYAEHIKNL